jgi:hypothetical protein
MVHKHQRARQVAGDAPTAEQAAAIVAAIERFMRATAPPSSAVASAPDGWQTAAVLEGVSRDPWEIADPPSASWINT